MKKIYILGLAILLVYCGFLTYQINLLKDITNTKTFGDVKIVNNEINGFSTDLTKIIEDNQDVLVNVEYVKKSTSINRTGVIIDNNENYARILVEFENIFGDDIKVKFDNGEVKNATLLCYDKLTSLALLDVEIDFLVNKVGLTTTTNTNIGEWVVGIEASSSSNNSMLASIGIISSNSIGILHDTNRDTAFDVEVKVTNADINSNLVGPIFNLNGDMIGYKVKEGFEVISSEEINLLSEMSKHDSKVERVELGISVENVAELQTYQKSNAGITLDLVHGVVVSEISTNSLCEELIVNDVITKVNDVEINDWHSFYQIINELDKGDSVNLTYLRGMDQLNCSFIIS